MIDIPLNKALVAVEINDRKDCQGCFFLDVDFSPEEEDISDFGCLVSCNSSNRKDGKNVIFKLVDLPEEGK